MDLLSMTNIAEINDFYEKAEERKYLPKKWWLISGIEVRKTNNVSAKYLKN